MKSLSAVLGALLVSVVGCGRGPLASDEITTLEGVPAEGIVARRDAFAAFEAKRFDAQSGIRVIGDYIGSLDNGDWVRYRGVDFGAGANLWRANVAVPAVYAGQKIEVHVDGVATAPVGVLTVASTGAWTSFGAQSAPLSVVTGVHDLYLKVVGGSGAGNITTFTFAADPSLGGRDAFGVIDATDIDGQSGITDFGGYIGSLDGGDWVRYDDINFGSGATQWRAKVSVPAEYAGQKLELRLDGTATPVVGTLTLAGTGGWTTFVEQVTPVSGVAGIHDLYVKAVGASGVANIAAFTFGKGGTTPPVEPPPPPPATCTLTASGPVSATADGQVIENLSITSSGSQAILVNGRSGVVIRNVRIQHSAGVGIRLTSAQGVTIENVSVEFTSAPAAGANSSYEFLNIAAYQAHDLTVRNVRLTRGSSGIYLQQSDRSRLSFIEGHDFRGPFPRGQLVQWNNCNGGLLEDFSVQGDLATTWSEDNVNAYQSDGVTVRRGLIDGNNAPSGCGVIADAGSSHMLIEDVDALNQGNACFAAYTGSTPSDDVRFRRVRCKDTFCGSVAGRGPPSSGGLILANYPANTNIGIEASSYFNHCRDQAVWDASSISPYEMTVRDFTPRAAIRATLCWE
ncbi:MAG: carbohydrate-binding protein [Myxococcota bacterium]